MSRFIHLALLHVNEAKCRLTRNGILSLQALSLLTRADNLTGLATLINSNNLNLLRARRLLQVHGHLLQHLELIERQFSVKDGLGSLLGRDQTLLEILNEWHSLLHFTKLANLGVKVFVVDRDAYGVKSFADEVNVLFLPGGELLGCEDRDLLGLSWVEVCALALGKLADEVGLRREDVGGG